MGWFNKRQKEENVSTVKIAVWYVISNLFVKGLNIISTPIFTRLLSQEEYGEFSNFTAWEGILLILISFQFHATLPRAKYDYQGRIDEYMKSITVLSNLFAIGFFVLVEFNQTLFENIFSMDIFYIRLLCVYLFFAPAFSYLQTKHRMYNKYKMFVALAIVSAVVRMLVSIVAVISMNDKLMARTLGYILPITFINLVVWFTIILTKEKPNWTCMKYAFVIALPLVANALAGNILSTSDRFLIKRINGAEDNALYTVAYSCTTVLSIIWTSMNQAWTPWLYDRLHAGENNVVREKSNWYLGAFVVLSIAILLVIPEIIYIMGGEAYYEARYVMPPVIVGFVCQFIYGMYVNIETYEKKTWNIIVGTAGAAIINVVLNLILLPRVGYLAAAYTTLVGYFFLMLFHYMMVMRFEKYNDVYDKNFIVKCFIIVFVLHLVAMFLYKYTIVRYVCFVVYVIAVLVWCYKNLEQIKQNLRF